MGLKMMPTMTTAVIVGVDDGKSWILLVVEGGREGAHEILLVVAVQRRSCGRRY
jgi:hypothetical protein